SAVAPTTPAAPRFTDPARTWESLLAALGRGDRVAAEACFVPSALGALDDVPDASPIGALRALVSSFSRIENVGRVGPYWSIYGVRERRRPKWIFFEETADGEWKIAGL
ncbi:MAG TPA: hypothetical protein VD788_02635, partial [Candidatus Polarisedimenticolaceae bacterium]|nr:hypothetical protein [Candidatus Polarisedimenticolaceae bacterium]